MHPLLARQIKKKLPGKDISSGPWADFVAAVDAAYQQADQEREFVERTLDVVSGELTQANEQIRRDADNRLRDLSRYYEQTLELQQGMIVCFRKEAGVFVHTLCRGVLATRLGWTAEKVEHHQLGDFLPPERVAELSKVYEQAWSGEAVTWEGVGANEDLWYLAQLQPRFQDGAVTEVILSAVESSELKRSEAALRLAKEKAESADRAKSDFLAVMSHEIRTPMNSVIGFTSLLRETPLNSDQERYVHMIENSGEGLLDIINDVLDISKIEAGRLELSMEPVDAVLVANDVVEMMRARADTKAVQLSVTTLTRIPHFVHCDRARLRQVLVNLVGNAVKFTSQGSVRVELSYAHEGHVFTGRVVDTGIGIPEDSIERLFKPFSQVDSSTTRNYGGTGLGLVICRRLCEALGGGITVTSTPGEGSSFEFSMRAEEAADPIAAIQQTAAAPARDAADDPLILVVDDNPTNRRVAGLMLETSGYRRLDFAVTGEEAVEKAKTQSYDLIFMDIEMPGMDGVETTGMIRALPRVTATKPWIVGLSANVMKETRERGAHAGMNRFLSKPVKRDTVVEAVASRGNSD
ncbi:ATP-binding protein [Synoicihabitans lomoniglobus]|uniref:histidine kinase n=1 Tax=Synoicihabitans lomoniglobus TaxID=2909285 RepID=A0AAE9ZSZ9_9BACT|nr:ATP-binding protein [Opitutaceae bacterium LMO-M01]WED64650.1 ATP-binding protein [Opitutaceae bacterium LMO-M01]